MAFPVDPIQIRVELALGANPGTYPSTWDWTDVTQWVRRAGSITITRGRPDEFGTIAPASCSMTVDNADGRWVSRNPRGAWYTQIRKGVPLRVSVNPGDGWHVRFTGFIDALPPRQDASGRNRYVPLTASGTMKRLSKPTAPLRSAAYRYGTTASEVRHYLPLEDGEGAQRAASALAGKPDGQPFGGYALPRFGAVVGPPGSGSLPDVSDRRALTGLISSWGDDVGQWSVSCWISGATASGGTSCSPVQWQTTGTAGYWTLLARWPGDGAGTPTPAGSLRIWVVAMSQPGETFALEFIDNEVTISSADGDWHHVRVVGTQVGGDIEVDLYVDGVLVDSSSESGWTIGVPTRYAINPTTQGATYLDVDGIGISSVGHLMFGATGITTDSQEGLAGAAYLAGLGWPAERAGRRVERVRDEEGLPLAFVDEYRVLDTFARTVSNGWGSADTGEAWTTSGGTASDYAVGSGAGTIAQGSTTVVRAVLLDNPTAEYDLRVLIEVPQVATGGSVGMYAGIVARWSNSTTHYRCHLAFTPGAGVFLGWADGGGIGFASETEIAPSYAAGDRFWLRASGSGSVHRARAWAEGDAEPTTWTVTGYDGTLTSGDLGVFARRGSGDTSANNVFEFSSLSARSILDETQPMGPQSIDSLLGILRECVATDNALLYDAFAGELAYPAGPRRYNADVVLALDWAQRQVGQPFEPTDDDQQLRNVVTASRRTGTSATYEDADHVELYGRYEDGVQVNPATDSALLDHAAWRVRLGTVDDLRVPTLSLNLAHPQAAALVADWLACDIGSRVTVANIPQDYSTDGLDVLIEGYTETIQRPRVWSVQMNCSPAAPYTVAVVEDPVLGRLDTDGTKLIAACAVGTDTTAQVVVTDGPTWITRATSTYAAMFPFDVSSLGVDLRVLAVGQILNSNAFFETDVSGWGATTGATIAHSTAQAHSGTGSMLITPDGVTAIVGATVMQSANAVVSAGVDYLIAGWLRSSGAVSDARMAIDWYQSNGSTFISSGLPSSISLSAGVWTYYAAVVTSPALAARARLRVRLAGTPSGSIWADECVLISVGSYAGPSDNFTRSVAAGGWGTSSTGHAWSINAGTAANFSVTGTVGRVAPTATNDLHLATIDTGSADADPTTEVVIPVVPTGAAITIRAVARYTDTANYYYTELTIATTGLATLKLFKRVSNVATQLGSTVQLSGVHAAADRWVVQCSAIGDTIRARGWRSTLPADRGWHITETDTALTAGTRVGVAARRETGNTDGTQDLDFDNVTVSCLQVMTIDTTPVNGVIGTIPAGTPLSLADPMRLAL